MKLEQVIKLGEMIGPKPNFNLLQEPAILTAMLIGIVLSVLPASIIYMEMRDGALAIAIFLACAFATVFGSFSFSEDSNHDKAMNDYNNKIEHWKENIAYLYIETLPTKKRELNTVILDTQKFNGVTYTDELPLIVSFNENGKTITTSSVYEIEERLEEGEKPFMEFKRLNDALGHGMNPGSYFIKVVTPKNFKLEPSSK